ncbi:N-acetyl-1-D-myo-inositol-2-amino-2-deoxy-alpha-D-glucopyranoside deacetylase [Mycetocola sp. CAN_C7]|uniref:PIG-L deacetylase family protein n=1 Tax=Mycetocola sp. CAN_C7 TaxID=2787724 RepID=UPI0018C95570
MTDLLPTPGILDGVSSVLFAHAHPDDETLASGGLIAELVARGVRVTLLTASRGERGEIVSGALPADTDADALTRARENELAGAVAALGISAQYWLGEQPARAAGLPLRRYRDSGMEWIRPGLAGPAGDADADALSVVPLDQVVDDVAALLAFEQPSLVISYDSDGGYGHPDHVRIGEAALAASVTAGIPYAELLETQSDAAEWFALSGHHDRVTAALRCHASQLTVVGDDIVHSGGQRHPIGTDVGLRIVEPADVPALSLRDLRELLDQH